MKKNTKHKEVIIAFLNGQDVEIYDRAERCWGEVPENPMFSEDREYRIKPLDVSEWEVYKTWVLSTAHLPRQELDLLAAIPDAWVIQRDVGFIIKLYGDPDYWLDVKYNSPNCVRIAALARKSDILSVEFAWDGPIVSGLPVFEEPE